MRGVVQPEPGPHRFQEQLDWSEAASAEPFWEAVYRQAFPNLVSLMPCPGDFESQRLGIDRVILLSNGQLLKIDEKKRRKDYRDVLLEWQSNDATGAPGWIEKDLAIDYLAYAIMPTLTCYLFPWTMLRRAWEQNKLNWWAEAGLETRPVGQFAAQNVGYATWSLSMPIGRVYQAVANASRIVVDPGALLPDPWTETGQ